MRCSSSPSFWMSDTFFEISFRICPRYSSQSGTLSHSDARYGRTLLSSRFWSRFAVTNLLSMACAFSSLRAILRAAQRAAQQ